MIRLTAILLCTTATLLPPGCHPEAQDAAGNHQIVVDAPPPVADWTRLIEANWHSHVGDELGLWVSVARQRLVGIRTGVVRFAYPCSTAARGVGNRERSFQTPLGWHMIDERYGDNLPKGAIFRERRYTGAVWTPDRPTTDDLILSRVMWLQGLEPGINQGPGIDSHDRYIYIHGTPEEEKLGSPASMGCIRLSNDDVIELYDRAGRGTRVLITAW